MEIQEQNQTQNPNQPVSEIETTAPGKLRVIKRNGKVVAFEDDKIKVAITMACLAIESGNAENITATFFCINSFKIFSSCFSKDIFNS